FFRRLTAGAQRQNPPIMICSTRRILQPVCKNLCHLQVDRPSISTAKSAFVPINCRLKSPSSYFAVSFSFRALLVTTRANESETQNGDASEAAPQTSEIKVAHLMARYYTDEQPGE